MNKTFEEKLNFEEKKWMKTTFLTGLLAFVSLVFVYVFFPNAITPLTSIWTVLFCFSFGVTIGIMYVNKISQKKTKKGLRLTSYGRIKLFFAYVTIGGAFLFLRKLDKIVCFCLKLDREEKN